MTGRSEFSRIAVELYGRGRVGRALLPLLARQGIPVACVHDSRGASMRKEVDGPRVVVDATAPHYRGTAAREWVTRLEETLEGGTPVVTCNKAPLALAWRALEDAARRGRTTVSCAATVGGGTPILPVLERLDRTRGIERVDAEVNATCAFVHARVIAGATLAAAVEEAQRRGFAEPDPRLDLDGTDTRAKAVIIHNLVFRGGPTIALGPEWPRLALTEAAIRASGGAGGPPRLTARISPGDVRIELARGPRAIARSAEPGEASVRALHRDGTSTWIVGPGAGPEATAGAILGDLWELAAGPTSFEPGVRA